MRKALAWGLSFAVLVVSLAGAGALLGATASEGASFPRLISNCDTADGWIHDAGNGSVSLDTEVKNEGTGSVKVELTNWLYLMRGVGPESAYDFSGAKYFCFDLWVDEGETDLFTAASDCGINFASDGSYTNGGFAIPAAELKALELHAGWNQVALPLPEVTESVTADITKINTMRLYSTSNNAGRTVRFDNVRLTDSLPEPPTEEDDSKYQFMSNCDDLDGWDFDAGNGSLSLDTEEKRQGSASLKATLTNSLFLFRRVGPEYACDFTGKAYLAFDMWIDEGCEDIFTSAADCGINLTSDGSVDQGGFYIPSQSLKALELTVKSGVEILGSMDNPHHTKITSTVFFTDYGKNSPDGEALITLQSKAGLRGFTVFYDKQSTADILPYAYTIRGAGSDIYIVNVTLSYTYQGIDLKTNRCDNHYIEGAAFGALKNGITVGGGSTGGLIRDVQANIHYISDNWFEGAERDVTKVLDYNHQNLEGFVISTTSKQTMFNNFIFGAWHGIALVDEADAYIIGHGTDSGIKSVYLNSTGSKPINFVNTQLVNLGDGDKNYILADAGFTGTVNFYNTNVWGIPSNAVVVNSGSLNLISGTFFECGGAGITVKGGEASISGVYLGKRTLADFNIEQGAAGFRAFGNTYTYTKRIQNEAGIALKGSDCK